jgi:hypothetical protein
MNKPCTHGMWLVSWLRRGRAGQTSTVPASGTVPTSKWHSTHQAMCKFYRQYIGVKIGVCCEPDFLDQLCAFLHQCISAFSAYASVHPVLGNSMQARRAQQHLGGLRPVLSLTSEESDGLSSGRHCQTMPCTISSTEPSEQNLDKAPRTLHNCSTLQVLPIECFSSTL